MKNFLVRLKIKHGEYEFYSNVIIGTRTPATDSDKLAKTFYGKGQKDGDGYYFNGGELFVSPMSVRQLTKMQARILEETGAATRLY